VSHARPEVEAAFTAYIAKREEGDWDAFCDLFTEDATYVEHEFGTFVGREAIRAWMVPTMAPLADWTFPTEWVAIDGDRVVFCWQNRMPNPDGRAEPYQFAGVTNLVYAGDGLWSLEEDFYNMKECESVVAEWAAAQRAG
jgi:uncharacterized protein (TIGR02246 family)